MKQNNPKGNKNQSQIAHVNKWLQKGRKVWVKELPAYPNPFEDAFLEAEVVGIHEKQISVNLTEADKQFKVPLDSVLKLTYGPNDVSDMVDLEQLNEPELLFNTKRRYMNDLIFTYCGPTLVIINPYAFIQKLFNDTVLQQYQTMVFSDNLQYKTMPPHIFSLAAFCLWQLFDNQRNQSIVISGESGAGKTQNTKYCLKFLASLGKNMTNLVSDPSQKSLQLNHQNSSMPNKPRINLQGMREAGRAMKKGGNNKVFGMEQKILGCNEILEAFGNSKTIRNDNSSRFGKLILLVYGETKIDIKSAFIISYLLEKSRIVSVSDGQRNYHIFYYFCKGTSPQQKQKYKLNDPITKYYYLNQSSTYDIPKGGDQQNFLMIKKQFEMYLKPEEIDCIYRILSIILNIGNLLFEKGENKNNEEIVTIKNEEYLKTVAELLEIQYAEFKHCFQYRSIKTRQGTTFTPWKYDQVMALRDSFSKNIYEKVFNLLVLRLNQKIQIEKIDFQSNSKQYRKSIGLLDIFGFEVLLINSLEQFFINFANEKLQQLYVLYIFKQQKNQFLRQGLHQFSHQIGFQDNKPIIDLFQLFPLGIFHLINQSSQLNKPDQNLPDTIIKNHKVSYVTIPKNKRGHFQIDHSCSPVSYNAVGFTAKNKDQFPRQLLEIIRTTRNATMKSIIVGEEKEEDTKGKKASSKFLGSKFLAEMNKLIQELYSCDCHFVRCIKPNSKKSPKLFNSESVLQSLRYLGVLDSIKIRKLGYIYRRPYKQFYKKFYQLQRYIFSYNNDIQGKSQDDFRQQSRKIIQKHTKKQLQENDILFGAKKILIKQAALNHLQLLTKQKRRQRLQTANRIKMMYKRAVFRVHVKKKIRQIKILKAVMLSLHSQVREYIINRKAIRIQNVIRKYLWHLRLQKIKQQATKSVTKISAYYKMKKQRRLFLLALKNIVKVQANIRNFLSVKKFEKEMTCQQVIKMVYSRFWEIIKQKNALLIQKNWRGTVIRKRFKQILKLMKFRAFVKRAVNKTKFLGIISLLQAYKRPIIKLQAIVKCRYLRRTFLKVKRSCIIIQRAYKRHLHKKYYLLRAWEKYKQNISITQKQKLQQLRKIGVNIKSQQAPKTTLIQTLSSIQKASENQLRSYLTQSMPQQARDIRINETIPFSDKNTMQCYIMDFDIISTLNYRGKWAHLYGNLKGDLARKQEYPLRIDVSEAFTCVTSNKERVYTFGQYEEGEDDQISRTELKTCPNSICVNNQSIYIVTKQNQLYEWGDNKNGELFMQTSEKTVRLQYISSVNSAKDVEVRGQNKYYVDSEGKVYNKQNKIIKLITFNQRVQINNVIASYSFVHFLTSTGQVYSTGSNSYGQLGNQRIKIKTTEPTLNEYFSISVGFNHTVARSKLGYVYAWGDNRLGQVTWQNVEFVRTPVQLQLDKQKVKVLQAVAGFRSTYLLMQSLMVLGMGTTNIFDTKKSQTYHQIDLVYSTTSNPKNLIPLKLSCTWTRQMSILSINCLEQNKCKPGTKPDVIIKYCKIIAREWPEKMVYPEYHQWSDNILNLGDMRKFKFTQQKTGNTKPKVGGNNAQNKIGDSELDELKILMDLRKISTLFKTAARNKIQQIVKRLGSKTSNQWTKQDQQLNLYIKQYCKAALY